MVKQKSPEAHLRTSAIQSDNTHITYIGTGINCYNYKIEVLIVNLVAAG